MLLLLRAFFMPYALCPMPYADASSVNEEVQLKKTPLCLGSRYTCLRKAKGKETIFTYLLNLFIKYRPKFVLSVVECNC